MTLSLANHFRVFMCVVFMGVLVGCVYTIKKDVTDNEYIAAVKGGYLNGFSDVTVREAFNHALIEPYWRYYQAKTGQHVVELSGRMSHSGQKGHAIVQFVVDEDRRYFKLGAMKFNEVVQDVEQKWTFVGNVYDNWYSRRFAYE